MEWQIAKLRHDTWEVRLQGRFDVDDYFRIVAEFEEFSPPVHNRLWDLRSVDMRRTELADIQRIVDHMREGYREAPGGKTAHLVTRGLTFGLSRMVGAYIDETPRQLQVFTDRGEALIWLLRGDQGESR